MRRAHAPVNNPDSEISTGNSASIWAPGRIHSLGIQFDSFETVRKLESAIPAPESIGAQLTEISRIDKMLRLGGPMVTAPSAWNVPALALFPK